MGGKGSGGYRAPGPGKKLGRPTTPEGPRRYVTAQLTPSAHAALSRRAEASGRSLSAEAAAILELELSGGNA